VPTSDNPHALGGFTLSWLLAAPVRSYTAKATGKRRSLIELCDPQRLKRCITIFLDGEAGPKLESVPVQTVITLHVTELAAGDRRGELIATADRSAVEGAFERAGRTS
jgi:hypothetical protein